MTHRSYYSENKRCGLHPRFLSAGVPQGTTLSSILYSLYTIDIPRSEYVHLAMYADDTALYTSSRNTRLQAERLQKEAHALGEWSRLYRIELNPEKSKAILFPMARHIQVSTICLLDKPTLGKTSQIFDI